MIVALGKFAAQCLLRDDTPITRLRGGFRSYEGIPLMPTLHPAYLLRDPSKKKLAWEDLKAVNAALARVGHPPAAPARRVERGPLTPTLSPHAGRGRSSRWRANVLVPSPRLRREG